MNPIIADLSGTGCLSRLVEHGIPAGPGEIGCVKPNVWRHLFWTDGTVWMGTTLADSLKHIPTLEELSHHLAMTGGLKSCPWFIVRTPSTKD